MKGEKQTAFSVSTGGFSATSLSLGTIPSLCGPPHPPLPGQCLSILLWSAVQFASCPPKVAGWPTVPRDASPHPCVSVFICSLGLFLTGGWPPPAGLFLSGVFLFTYPDLPSSHCHSFPHPPLGTGKLISPSCRAEFLSSVCPCVPLPAYLASPRWASHSMLVLVLVLVSSLQMHLSGSSYWHMQFLFLVFPRIPIAVWLPSHTWDPLSLRLHGV